MLSSVIQYWQWLPMAMFPPEHHQQWVQQLQEARQMQCWCPNDKIYDGGFYYWFVVVFIDVCFSELVDSTLSSASSFCWTHTRHFQRSTRPAFFGKKLFTVNKDVSGRECAPTHDKCLQVPFLERKCFKVRYALKKNTGLFGIFMKLQKGGVGVWCLGKITK